MTNKDAVVVNLADGEWRNKKETDRVVHRIIAYSDADGEEIRVSIPIRILPGTEYASIQESIIKRDEDGTMIIINEQPQLDETLGETLIVAKSTGLTPKEIDEIRRNKPGSFWQQLLILCNRYNSLGARVEKLEKNSDAGDL